MSVSIDTDSCLGCALCVTIYPELFEMGNDGHSKVKNGVVIDEKLLEKVLAHCPVQSIFKETEK